MAEKMNCNPNLSAATGKPLRPANKPHRWLELDESALKARLTRLPEADEAPFPVEIQLVVQQYPNRV